MIAALVVVALLGLVTALLDLGMNGDRCAWAPFGVVLSAMSLVALLIMGVK